MVSEDTSRFRYTNPTGHPSGLRISRILAETFRLGLPDVRWFVLGDDDTIFNPSNLVAVLSKYDSSSFLQRSICYDHVHRLSFVVSLGYVVQVYPGIVLPRVLERSEKTYAAWNGVSKRDEFDVDTRDTFKSSCKRPVFFFLKDAVKQNNDTLGTYQRAKINDDLKRRVFCFPQSPPIPHVASIRVLARPLRKNWHLVS
ncbi:hypothetical protein LINPERHAP1_LOCUS14748 [Linum perenne]